jgi:hypothetical protein
LVIEPRRGEAGHAGVSIVGVGGLRNAPTCAERLDDPFECRQHAAELLEGAADEHRVAFARKHHGVSRRKGVAAVALLQVPGRGEAAQPFEGIPLVDTGAGGQVGGARRTLVERPEEAEPVSHDAEDGRHRTREVADPAADELLDSGGVGFLPDDGCHSLTSCGRDGLTRRSLRDDRKPSANGP